MRDPRGADDAFCVLFMVAGQVRADERGFSSGSITSRASALDEFLELALTYEQREPASLQGFLAWMRAADTEIKRDMEISRDEVRVMTVHGAKGLEAPVVFLMDTTSSPTDTRRLSLIRLPLDAGGCVVWSGRKADDPPPVVAARQAMLEETEDEYRRLLYVAMTRAAERLVIGGIKQANRKRSPPWLLVRPRARRPGQFGPDGAHH